MLGPSYSVHSGLWLKSWKSPRSKDPDPHTIHSKPYIIRVQSPHGIRKPLKTKYLLGVSDRIGLIGKLALPRRFKADSQGNQSPVSSFKNREPEFDRFEFRIYTPIDRFYLGTWNPIGLNRFIHNRK